MKKSNFVCIWIMNLELYLSDIRKIKTDSWRRSRKKLQAFRNDVFYKRAMNKAVASIQYSEKVCEADIRQEN